ncbi:uncharacterized protein LOC110465112 [Mizuhopecten yessoensis]|uniref:Serine/threonine-protein kinase EDR1 n=1 Tax=Mizuhopecten yessoensis TaxID=6573 RepID=A0A210PSC0_MIZYE|nr:uncharacterized protein LOC110465112 [Mizuhopecten yessoensis]OWF39381.1 Serine/threonine-protein kinase EDR1 [Mizuhopecten yessoensis]
MDLMWKKLVEGSDNQSDGSVNSLPSSVPSKYAKSGSSWIQNQPQQHHFMNDILSSYSPCNDDELDIELYYGCEDGLFNLCGPDDNEIEPDVVRWKCISKPGEGLHEELRQRARQEECLTTLGVGTPEEKIPEYVQKAIYKRMRPATSTNGTQSASPMTECGSQTYWSGLKTRDAASQAVFKQTVDCGVQAKPMTEEFGTNTSPVRILTDSGIRMTPPHQSDRPSSGADSLVDHHLVVKLNSNEPVVVKIGGKDVPLNEEESAFVKNLIREELRLAGVRTGESSGDTGLAPHASAMGPINVYYGDFQPQKCGSGDLPGPTCHGAGQNVGSNTEKRQEFLQKSDKCKAGQMSEGEGIIRYHAELPFHNHNEKFLSTSSPFSRFGYNNIGTIPQSLTDIRIPVIYPKDVTLQKGQNGTEVLGRGSFGCVYLAKHQQCPFDVCVKEFEMDSATIYDVYHEAKLLIYLQTTKFVPFCLGLMESPFVSSDLSLIQECFARGCTLRMLLGNKSEVFVKRKWIAICYQLFWGLKMIHEKQVLLNDIKSDNILVDYNSNDHMNNIRFIDLGLASYRRGYKFCNDPAYLEQFENYAPEIRQGYHSTPASDLYAVGYLVDKISETFHIVEIDPIAQECTVEDPNGRSSCHSVLEKLEDIMETV